MIAIMVLLAFMFGTAVGLNAHYGHQWKMALIKGVIVTISTACVELLIFSLVWFWNVSQGKNEKPPERKVQRLEVSTDR